MLVIISLDSIGSSRHATFELGLFQQCMYELH